MKDLKEELAALWHACLALLALAVLMVVTGVAIMVVWRVVS